MLDQYSLKLLIINVLNNTALNVQCSRENLNSDFNNIWQDFAYLLINIQIINAPFPWEPGG